MNLWVEPNVPDEDGDIFDYDCLDNLVDQTDPSTPVYDSNWDYQVGNWQEYRFKHDDTHVLAPSFVPLEYYVAQDRPSFIVRKGKVTGWRIKSVS